MSREEHIRGAAETRRSCVERAHMVAAIIVFAAVAAYAFTVAAVWNDGHGWNPLD